MSDNDNIKYLNFLGSSEMVWDNWEMEEGLVWRRRYSTSPLSPLKPMLLMPYPNGPAGPALCFSQTGFVKKPRPSPSIAAITSSGTPWWTALKNPYCSQAFTMSFDTSDLSAERSITGNSIGSGFSDWTGLGEATTMTVKYFFLLKRWKKKEGSATRKDGSGEK